LAGTSLLRVFRAGVPFRARVPGRPVPVVVSGAIPGEDVLRQDPRPGGRGAWRGPRGWITAAGPFRSRAGFHGPKACQTRCSRRQVSASSTV